MLQNKLQSERCYLLNHPTIYLSITHNCDPPLNFQAHSAVQCLCYPAACWDFWSLYNEKCAGKTLEFPRNSRVLPSIYEEAWELVTKCPRNPRRRKFPTCFPHFLLRFLMFDIVFPLFLRAFPMFPLVFLPVSYFRSYVSNNHCHMYIHIADCSFTLFLIHFN